ncbi:MAG TPA: hypothetical protein VEY92_00275 [Pseudoxanthomonas sp.]|nr:hypothetical protein [Pseudoxanthomonas sp.]
MDAVHAVAVALGTVGNYLSVVLYPKAPPPTAVLALVKLEMCGNLTHNVSYLRQVSWPEPKSTPSRKKKISSLRETLNHLNDDRLERLIIGLKFSIQLKQPILHHAQHHAQADQRQREQAAKKAVVAS